MSTPLSILDLAPVKSGGTPATAIRETIDLALAAENAAYHRYWLAEHHFTPGVASSSPAVLIALVAAATRRIRVGSGASVPPTGSPTNCVSCATPPAPTNSSSPRSPTTTPTACARSTCSPRSGQTSLGRC